MSAPTDDRQQDERDRTDQPANQGVSSPKPAEGDDAIPGPDAGSARG